jgi:Dolichyl-phosphate-mannose-protein mannosyltransferase
MFWASAYILALKGTSKESLVAWLKDNWRGLVLAAAVSLVAILAVPPALRVLADETNLLGVSKNLFFNKTADFATTGKWYYETYWNLNVTMDRRPALFPFLVSLVHAVRGYRYTNVFFVNAILIPFFVFVAYRLAKSLGNEVYGIVAGAFALAHPVALVSVRSGGFEVMAALFALVCIKHFLDYARQPTANRLALLWLNLCMLAHIRYEGAVSLVAAFVVLFALRMVKWEHVKPYAFVYAFTPLFALPRIWQTILKADDGEQPLNATLFGWKHLSENTRNYFGLVLNPFDFAKPHSALLLLLGLVGCLLAVRSLWKLFHERERSVAKERFAIFAVVWVAVMATIYFPYFWGKPLHPASARLFVPLDVFLSLMAAWLVALLCRRAPLWLPALVAAAALLVNVSVASEARFINELTLTREAAQIWRYFEQIHDKNIMVVTDRPGLYTVMDYGAQDLSVARQGQDLMYELSRHLYRDMYVIQEMDLTTKKPLPEFEIWPEHKKEVVLEFQNAENSTVRIARMTQEPTTPPPLPPLAPAAP